MLSLAHVSHSAGRHCRFSDHAPHLFHTASWRNRLVRTLGTHVQNMNCLNIEVSRHGQVQVFASVYGARQMAANLALAHVGLPMLRALQGKNLALPLPYYPIQVWTKDSLVEIDLEFTDGKIIAKGRTAEAHAGGLHLAKRALQSCGFRRVHHTTTLPGLGFHHHALRVSPDGRRYESAEQYVAREFGEGLRIADGSVLAQLTPREAKVLRMRFGIDMNTDHTLEEVGKQFDVTRERIRQIEAKALRKLRHPSRSEQLRSFLIDD